MQKKKAVFRLSGERKGIMVNRFAHFWVSYFVSDINQPSLSLFL
jgi:hypothetical protein